MKRKAKIFYIALDDFWRKEEKLEWLRDNPIEKIAFEHIAPDEKHNWINQTDNDWDILLPLIDKNVKAGKSEVAVFKLFSPGISTQCDEWTYDVDESNLNKKIRFFVETYKKTLKDNNYEHRFHIKWHRNLDRRLKSKREIEFNEDQILACNYRPFNKINVYYDTLINAEVFQFKQIFPLKKDLQNENKLIAFTSLGSQKPFLTLATDVIVDYHFVGAAAQAQCLPLYRYDSENQKHENITDWGLTQFRNHYGNRSEPSAVGGGLTESTQKIKGKKNYTARNASETDSMAMLQPSATADGSDRASGAKITKQDIFYYVYAVLHSPVYRKKYEQNLKREFPRLPFYDDFFEWRDWGAKLMDLHINYETVEPFALERKDLDLTPKRKIAQNSMFDQIADKTIDDFVSKPKTKLRANKEQGVIEIDSLTTLTNVPALAWEYKLGNRSALEWVLDQYKEKKPSDATIAEKFNTYKFEDYKEHIIDLLKRVCTVSVKTMEIVNQMPKD